MTDVYVSRMIVSQIEPVARIHWAINKLQHLAHKTRDRKNGQSRHMIWSKSWQKQHKQAQLVTSINAGSDTKSLSWYNMTYLFIYIVLWWLIDWLSESVQSAVDHCFQPKNPPSSEEPGRVVKSETRRIEINNGWQMSNVLSACLLSRLVHDWYHDITYDQTFVYVCWC